MDDCNRGCALIAPAQGAGAAMHRWVAAWLALVCLSAVAWAQQGRRPPAEKTIRDADAVWSRALENKDLEQALSFYADDASLLPFNAPIATGKVQIREFWSHWLSAPGFSMRFAPSDVEVAHSGDLAYEVGTFELTLDDTQGRKVNTPGKYVVVWKQTAQGWKAATEICNTDLQSSEKQ
jgi:ketosteroid isomerase-like protein